MNSTVKTFYEISPDEEARAGGKGGTLAKLIKAGYPVPDEPGLGVDVNEELLQEPFKFYELPHLYKSDGSFTNW